MPIDPSILTDLSSAPITNIIGGPEISPSVAAWAVGNDQDVTQSLNQYSELQTQVSALQFPSDQPKYWFKMAFSSYSRQDLFQVNATLNTSQYIILPMPQSINDHHEVDYDEVPFGPLAGNIFNNGVDSFRNTMAGAKNLTDLGNNLLTQGGQALTNPANAQTAVGTGLATGINALDGSPWGISQAARAYYGISPNEFFTIMLKGPQYKKFSFEWHLVPRSFPESQKIKDIIRFLNNAMSPGLALGGSLFSFPLLVRCAFMPNYRYLFRFKPAVIASVDFDYSPGGQPAFYHDFQGGTGSTHNPPESVKLKINLIEMEYWLKSDFQDDVGPDVTTGNARDDGNTFSDITSLPIFQSLYNKATEFLKAPAPGGDVTGASPS